MRKSRICLSNKQITNNLHHITNFKSVTNVTRISNYPYNNSFTSNQMYFLIKSLRISLHSLHKYNQLYLNIRQKQV